MNQKKETKKQFFARTELFVGTLIFLLYIGISIWLSDFYTTLQTLPYYTQTLNWPEFLLAGFFTLTIGTLIAANTVLGYRRYTTHKSIQKQSTTTCAAAVAGIATGVCPICIGGIVPPIAALLGTSLSWASLPFKGLEIQAGIILLLGGTVWLNK